MEVVVVTRSERHRGFAGLLGDPFRGAMTSPEGEALAALGEAQVVDLDEV